MSKYVMGIDQSTQGTKVILFDLEGKIAFQAVKPHKQFINDKGWVEHDPNEIWRNVKTLAQEITQGNGISASDIIAIGIMETQVQSLGQDDPL